MSNIQIFNFNNSQIRIEIVNGEPFFCLVDVANILDIKNQNDLSSRLSKDGVDTIDTIDKLGRKQSNIFINEKNLYRVIFQSRKETASVFQDWVFDTVLPTIRKTGRFDFAGDSNKLLDIVLENSKIEKQIENSKKTNQIIRDAYNGDYSTINATITKEITGKYPKEWKEIAKEQGVKSKDRQSGKQAIRSIDPVLACGVSNADYCFSDLHFTLDDSVELGKLVLPLANKMIEASKKSLTPPPLPLY